MLNANNNPLNLLTKIGYSHTHKYYCKSSLGNMGTYANSHHVYNLLDKRVDL